MKDGHGSVATHRLLLWSDGSVRSVPLVGDRWVVGRAIGCDIVVRDPSVSRRHLLLQRTGDRFAFQDLGGSNPVAIGGKPTREGVLPPDVPLTVGATRLLLQQRTRPSTPFVAGEAPQVIARELADEDAGATADRATMAAARALQRLEWTFADFGDLAHAAEPLLDLALNLTGRRRGWLGRFGANAAVEALAELDLSEGKAALPLAAAQLDEARRLGRPNRVRVLLGGREIDLLFAPLGDGQALLALAGASADAPSDQDALRLLQALSTLAWHRLRETDERMRLRAELQQLRFRGGTAHAGLLASTRLQNVRAALRSKAGDGEPLLLTGEPGCELEELARFAHAESDRRSQPFVAWDAAAAPAREHARELLGDDGLAPRAAGGTLFVANAEHVAAATLDALRRTTTTGGSRPALIAASTLPTAQRVRSSLGDWLPHRHVEAPPLREQPGDVLLLAELMLAELGPGPNEAPRTLTERAKRLLVAHSWPGNVRELRHAIESAAALAGGEPIAPRHLPPTIHGEANGAAPDVPTLEEMERAHIVDVLQRTGGNRSRTAHLLGIAVSTLYEKLRRYRIAD